jgi:hypothetical protein
MLACRGSVIESLLHTSGCVAQARITVPLADPSQMLGSFLTLLVVAQGDGLVAFGGPVATPAFRPPTGKRALPDAWL